MYDDKLQNNLRMLFELMRLARQEMAEVDALDNTIERSLRHCIIKDRIGRIEMQIDAVMKEA